jgi:predicted nucleic acid-binding Zn ribbon protein
LYNNRPSRQSGKKAPTTPKPIAGVMENVVKSLGIARSYHGWLAVTKWPEIVGDQVAKVAKAFRFADGVLFVAVPDSVWRQTLSMQADDILQKIRSYPFGRAVIQLRFVQGEKGLN